jgi:hypothetical protein
MGRHSQPFTQLGIASTILQPLTWPWNVNLAHGAGIVLRLIPFFERRGYLGNHTQAVRPMRCPAGAYLDAHSVP